MQRGKGAREGIGPEEERGWKNEGKSVGGKGPENPLEKISFSTPMTLVLFSGLSSIGGRYDWTTWEKYDGNEWRRCRVARAPPCVPVFLLNLKGLEEKGLSTSRGDVGSLPLYGGPLAQSNSVAKVLAV